MEKNLKRTLTYATLIVILALSTASKCDDDEAPQPQVAGCEGFQNTLDSLYDKIDMDGYDCEKMPKIFDDILDLLNDQKDCAAAKQLAKDKGFDSVDAYITSLSKSFDAYLSDCPG